MSTPKVQQRREFPSTPLSPSVASRKDEKEQMVNLNNRMAVYVEKVRSLESENSRLQIRVTSFEQTSSREVGNMKAMFEGELAEARRLLDELSKEKAQLQIEASSYREKYEAEKNRANLLEHDNDVLEKKIKDLTNLLSSKEGQYTRVKNERDEFAAEIESLKAKISDLQSDLDSVQKLYENETLQRVDFENKLQSVKEELMFKERLFREEISEVRQRHTVSMTEINDKVKGDYEHKLEAAIIDLRDQQQSDLEALKEELEGQYNAKISDLKKQLDYSRKTSLKGNEAAKGAEMKVDRLQNTIQSLQHQNNKLSNRVQDLEGTIETERQLRIAAVIEIERERDEARDTLTRIEKDYSELLDIKLQLDQEIAVYRKLLEEEENRLHLTPEAGEGSEGKGRTRSRRKRKRVVPQTTEGESRSKRKQEVTTTTSVTETVVIEQSQQSSQAEPSAEGSNSCLVM
uniref:Nuclear lamin L1 beta n=1 Tax=Urochordate sp. AZ-2003 TaxID=220543 RepID=Q9GNN2_9UROC|nr:nuclear lamin L1 beta [Urochordate sp. AZ-2003]